MIVQLLLFNIRCCTCTREGEAQTHEEILTHCLFVPFGVPSASSPPWDFGPSSLPRVSRATSQRCAKFRRDLEEQSERNADLVRTIAALSGSRDLALLENETLRAKLRSLEVSVLGRMRERKQSFFCPWCKKPAR